MRAQELSDLEYRGMENIGLAGCRSNIGEGNVHIADDPHSGSTEYQNPMVGLLYNQIKHLQLKPGSSKNNLLMLFEVNSPFFINALCK